MHAYIMAYTYSYIRAHRKGMLDNSIHQTAMLYLPTYAHTSIHTCIHTYIHNTSIHKYIPAFLQSYPLAHRKGLSGTMQHIGQYISR